MKGSGVLGDPGLSMFIDSPCPDKDNPVKGLSTECSARSLESGSCWSGSSLSLGCDSDSLSKFAPNAPDLVLVTVNFMCWL